MGYGYDKILRILYPFAFYQIRPKLLGKLILFIHFYSLANIDGSIRLFYGVVQLT
ncbi:hypothetical protein D3C74_413620 [compost metagenome]